MIQSLMKELEFRKKYLKEESVQSIYFGGGTPSILEAEELNQLINKIQSLFHVEDSCEITLEANPEDLNKNYLQELIDIGINRLSIGVQSFNEEELKWMNRAHSSSQSIQSVENASRVGFKNISIDLIYGTKFQTPESWTETLDKAFQLPITHLSPYHLTIENKTTLGHRFKKGVEKEIEETISEKLFQILLEKAKQNNFIHYEISNFGKEGLFSRHNSSYWKGNFYLGIGPGAHSFNGMSRQWNISNNSLYIKGIEKNEPAFESEFLTETEVFNEFILTGIRTIWGVNSKEIENKFGNKYYLHLQKKTKPYLEQNLLRIENEAIVLTEKGKLIADRIASELFL